MENCVVINSVNPGLTSPFQHDAMPNAAGANPRTGIGSFNVTGLALGTTTLAWEYDALGFELNWFGLNPENRQAGEISITVVPEPATAALVSLGMLSLAIVGRRR